MSIPIDCSWIWRKVLKLRDITLPHISYNIGDGADINLLHDPWLHHHPLANSTLILNSGLGNDAKLNKIIHHGA